MKKLTHIDADNNFRMVDVSAKGVTLREAIAESIISFPESVFKQLQEQQFLMPKGGIFQVATLAGIMAVKKTADLIPLCHPLPINSINIDCTEGQNSSIVIRCSVKCTAKTGVEMEALTGASIAALTIYDMCKALTHDIVISSTKLIKKTGGKSDYINH